MSDLRFGFRRHTTWAAALMLALLLAVTPAFAQRQDGTLRGEVRDPSGAAVEGAKVTVLNEGTGVARETATSSGGVYTVPNLLVGSYTVTIEAPGFATHTRRAVQVNAAQVTEASARLVVGTAETVVDVVAGADVVQTESAQLSQTFDSAALAALPGSTGINTSVLNLAIFLPNTTTALGGTSGTGGSVGGLRGRQNSFTVDGVNNNDPSVTVASQQVIPDAVAEFSVTTNQFNAEYGNASGGQFNIVTKTGTNNWRGGAWWYNVNRRLNAMDNLEKASGLTRPRRYDFNRAGGNIGGPILTNRLFIYGAYEYQTRGLEGSAPTVTLPTAAGLATLNGLAANDAVRAILAEFPTASSASSTVPVTVGGVTTDIPVGGFTAFVPNFFNQHDYIINGDLNLQSHQLRGRYLKTRRRTPAFGPLPQPQFSGFASTDNQKAIFTDVWTVSNTFINDFRASFSRFEFGVPLSASALAYPNIQITSGLGVFLGPASNLPQSRITNQYQLANTQSYIRGRHTFKWGGDYRWYIGPSEFLQQVRGLYNYANLSELINDLVPSNQQLQGIGDGTFAQSAKNFSLFIQDDFKMARGLTVNFGLRYEFFGIAKGASIQERNSISDLPGTPLIFRKPKDDFNNFAPRVGVAWDPTGSGKWAVRGGFGVSFDTIPNNFYLNGAPPQKQAILIAGTACARADAPAWCASGQGFLQGGAMNLPFLPPATTAAARNITGNLMADAVSPKVYTWSFGIQRELAPQTSIEARYLGTRADQLPVQIQLNNRSAFRNGAQPLPTYFATSQIPAMVPLTAPSQQDFLNARSRPFAADGFNDVITSFLPVGESNYHGGSVDFNRRFNQGILLRANYTFAKTIDNSTNDLFTSVVNPRRPQDIDDIDAERGRSALDIRHKLALVWAYDLPKLNVGQNAVAGKVLHGWQWNGTWLLQSGQPITVQSGVDSNGNFDSAGDRAIANPNGSANVGTAVNFVCRGGGGATSVATSVAGCGGAASVVGYVAANPNARFVQAQLGALADIGRNTVNSPGFNTWNMSLFKNTGLTESTNLQFRFELFNVFNTRNFTLGNADVAPVAISTNAQSFAYANVTAPNFLNHKIFNGGSRQIQLGLKLTF